MQTLSWQPTLRTVAKAVLGRFLPCSFVFTILCAPRATSAPAFEAVYTWTSLPSSAPESGLILGKDGNFYGTTNGNGSNSGTVYKMTPAGVVTTLAQFTYGTTGSIPHAALVEGSDGNFYGTTSSGGALSDGTVFKMTPAGVLTTLVSFTGDGSANKGMTPESALVEGIDHNFYGTTTFGGTASKGTAFKVTPTGILTTLVEFGIANGANPAGGLVRGSDGDFYGATFSAGAGGFGTVFKMTPAGALTTLVSFTGNGATNKGANPYVGLTEGKDGNFYGITQYGGATDQGTIFKMTPAGVVTTLVQFSGNGATNKGAYPQAGLVQGSDGNFYGVTGYGGTDGDGTIFKMTPAGVLTTLVETSSTTGTDRYATLVQGKDGDFYGTTEFGGVASQGTVFKITPGGALATLAVFGINPNGTSPGALVKGSDGNLYGRTSYGGVKGEGTIFKLTTSGQLTTLVQLTETTGSVTTPSLVQASPGVFYGIDSLGLFKVTSAGVLTPLGSGTYVDQPSALILGKDGNFYGTSAGYTGTSFEPAAFRMSPTGVVTPLAVFVNDFSVDLGESLNGLVQGIDGNFYGTTQYGPGGTGRGSVFQMTPTGEARTLATFNGTNGETPQGGLVQGSDGNFYGTTESGGTDFEGTVFKVTPTGALTTLVQFDGANGGSPEAGLLHGTDGNFYGTTLFGGTDGDGTVFSVTPAGKLTTIADFTSYSGSPSKLVEGNDGDYYGSTTSGGAYSAGTVYRIRFGPTPTTVAASPVAATSATLHGTIRPNGGATTVTFEYGTSATLAGAATVSAGVVAAATVVQNVSAPVSKLAPKTRYYFRVVGKNAENTFPQSGDILTFVTP